MEHIRKIISEKFSDRGTVGKLYPVIYGQNDAWRMKNRSGAFYGRFILSGDCSVKISLKGQEMTVNKDFTSEILFDQILSISGLAHKENEIMDFTETNIFAENSYLRLRAEGENFTISDLTGTQVILSGVIDQIGEKTFQNGLKSAKVLIKSIPGEYYETVIDSTGKMYDYYPAVIGETGVEQKPRRLSNLVLNVNSTQKYKVVSTVQNVTLYTSLTQENPVFLVSVPNREGETVIAGGKLILSGAVPVGEFYIDSNSYTYDFVPAVPPSTVQVEKNQKFEHIYFQTTPGLKYWLTATDQNLICNTVAGVAVFEIKNVPDLTNPIKVYKKVPAGEYFFDDQFNELTRSASYRYDFDKFPFIDVHWFDSMNYLVPVGLQIVADNGKLKLQTWWPNLAIPSENISLDLFADIEEQNFVCAQQEHPYNFRWKASDFLIQLAASAEGTPEHEFYSKLISGQFVIRGQIDKTGRLVTLITPGSDQVLNVPVQEVSTFTVEINPFYWETYKLLGISVEQLEPENPDTLIRWKVFSIAETGVNLIYQNDFANDVETIENAEFKITTDPANLQEIKWMEIVNRQGKLFNFLVCDLSSNNQKVFPYGKIWIDQINEIPFEKIIFKVIDSPVNDGQKYYETRDVFGNVLSDPSPVQLFVEDVFAGNYLSGTVNYQKQPENGSWCIDSLGRCYTFDYQLIEETNKILFDFSNFNHPNGLTAEDFKNVFCEARSGEAGKTLIIWNKDKTERLVTLDNKFDREDSYGLKLKDWTYILQQIEVNAPNDFEFGVDSYYQICEIQPEHIADGLETSFYENPVAVAWGYPAGETRKIFCRVEKGRYSDWQGFEFFVTVAQIQQDGSLSLLFKDYVKCQKFDQVQFGTNGLLWVQAEFDNWEDFQPVESIIDKDFKLYDFTQTAVKSPADYGIDAEFLYQGVKLIRSVKLNEAQRMVYISDLETKKQYLFTLGVAVNSLEYDPANAPGELLEFDLLKLPDFFMGVFVGGEESNFVNLHHYWYKNDNVLNSTGPLLNQNTVFSVVKDSANKYVIMTGPASYTPQNGLPLKTYLCNEVMSTVKDYDGFKFVESPVVGDYYYIKSENRFVPLYGRGVRLTDEITVEGKIIRNGQLIPEYWQPVQMIPAHMADSPVFSPDIYQYKGEPFEFVPYMYQGVDVKITPTVVRYDTDFLETDFQYLPIILKSGQIVPGQPEKYLQQVDYLPTETEIEPEKIEAVQEYFEAPVFQFNGYYAEFE